MVDTTILIADDNHLIRMLVRNSLAPLGCRIIEAEDGARALDLARAEKPDVILLDVMMPAIHGYDVLEAIKSDAEMAKSRVIMLTAAATDAETLRSEHGGADGYIIKPFDKNELRSTVSTLLEQG